MSNLNSNPRSETLPGVLSRLDKNELKSIKVAITRRNVSEPNSSAPLLRSLDDPSQLIVHYRPDEGSRPIFDREDVIVNKENAQEERTILSSVQASSTQLATSRSSSRSSRSSVDRSPTKERKRSPQPHSSRDYQEDELPRDKDYYSSKYRRSGSHSRKAVYKTRKTPSPPPSRSNYKPATSHKYSRSPPRYRRSSSRDKSKAKREREHRSSEKDKSPLKYKGVVKQRSGTPSGYRGPADRRRSSRSPPSHRDKYESRSPHKYRGPPERRRSRTPPPPRRSSRGRSRSHSPYARRSSRSRYSRSPHRHRYERSKRSGSPRHHRYSPERHSRRSPHDDRSYQNPRIPTHPYFQGAEFWIPDPSMQPRFIPRQMIPPGPFPYGPPFRPGMPMMVPPQFQFRPRNVYNRPPRPRMITASETRTTTVTATPASVTTVAQVEDSANTSEPSAKPKESEHSSPKNNDVENKN